MKLITDVKYTDQRPFSYTSHLIAEKLRKLKFYKPLTAEKITIFTIKRSWELTVSQGNNHLDTYSTAS